MRGERATKVRQETPESEIDLIMSADQVPCGELVFGRSDGFLHIVNERRGFITLEPSMYFVVTGGTICYFNNQGYPVPHPGFASWKHRIPPGTVFVGKNNQWYTIEAQGTASVHPPSIHGGVHNDARGAQGTGHVNIGTVHGDVNLDHIGVGGAAQVFGGFNMSIGEPPAPVAISDIQGYHADQSEHVASGVPAFNPGATADERHPTNEMASSSSVAHRFEQMYSTGNHTPNGSSRSETGLRMAGAPAFKAGATPDQIYPTEEMTPFSGLPQQVEPTATEDDQTTLGGDSGLHISMQTAWWPDFRSGYTQGNAVGEVTSDPNSTANTGSTVNSNFPDGTNQIPNWTETLSGELVEALSRDFGQHPQTSD